MINMEKSIFRVALALLILLALPAVSHAQRKASTVPTVKLTKSEVKALGFGGKSYKQRQPNVWQISGGVTVYATHAYGSKIYGFAGPTPLFIAVGKSGKIISICAAPNGETPEYFSLASKELLSKWNGKTLKQAAKYKPDAVSGATFSSHAIIRTVNATAAALSAK